MYEKSTSRQYMRRMFSTAVNIAFASVSGKLLPNESHASEGAPSPLKFSTGVICDPLGLGGKFINVAIRESNDII